MKKFSNKHQPILTILVIAPTMVLSMSAVTAFRQLEEGGGFPCYLVVRVKRHGANCIDFIIHHCTTGSVICE